MRNAGDIQPATPTGALQADVDAATPERHLPARPRAPVSLVVLAVIATGFTLWATQSVVLPVLLAIFLALVGNPVIRLLRRVWVPRFMGALFVLVLGLSASVALGSQLVNPAAAWFKDAPGQLRQLAPKLRAFTEPVYKANQAAESLARAASGDTSRRPQVMRTAPDDPYRMLVTTPRLLAQVLAVVLLTFFFMVYGENLQRAALALLPDRQKQKFGAGILHSIERTVSRYVLTISLINTLVGVVYAGALLLLKFPLADALLWGTVVALLNFAPYVGPLVGMAVMLVVGLTAFDDPLRALVPAAIYLGLHTLEGQILTPIVLGRSMRLSPLVLVLGLMVFGSMWGFVGLLLAVPLLVCIKLVLAHVDGLQGWARLLE